MGRVYYNKLIRDCVKDTIEGKGSTCEVRAITDNAEFQQELLKKVREEAEGVAKARNREEFLDEYADLMVVLDGLAEVLDISEAEIQVALSENIERKGKYQQRHFLNWSSDDSYKSNETPQGIHHETGS